MPEKPDDWRRLAQLTATVFDSAANRMKQLQRRETTLRATLAALEADRRSAFDLLGNPAEDPAQRAGAGVLWQQWIDRRRSALNAELARTLVQIDIARTGLARAYGRHQATDDLARRAAKAHQARHESMKERGW